MKKGTIVIGSLTCVACATLGILDVTAAPDGRRSETRQRQTQSASVNQSAPSGASEGGVAGNIGPDVTASRVGLNSTGSGDDIAYYGVSNVNGENIRAFSLASTSCNEGDQTAEWIPGGRNPVIAQNLFRLHDGKFEQVGISWLKHSFCAVSETTCGSCSPTGCSSLGIGCADTYWATLNGDNGDMGPRWLINPQGVGEDGVHNDIYSNPQGPSTIRGRLQVKDSDIIGGATYFAEIQYVTHDEPFANRYNNASYRRVNVTTTSMTGTFSGQASVHRGDPAIQGWKDLDPNVQLTFGNDLSPAGRFNLGTRVYDNGDGTWTYEYALHNLNSRRAGQSFSIPLPANVEVTNVGFHDVPYHSGDGVNYVTYDSTDWTSTTMHGAVRWATQAHAENANANALRWGTLYNFRFTADTPPQNGQATVFLFLPATGGEPTSLSITTQVPSEHEVLCTADTVGDDFNPPGDGNVDGFDLAFLLGEWGPNPGSPADMVGDDFLPPADGNVDGFDLAFMLGEWGACD